MTPFAHVDDYPEIPVSVASTRTALFTGAWRSVRPVLRERSAPCTAGCPAGIGMPAYLDDIAAGRLEAAFAAVTAHNPFPRITGRVCPHPCEASCSVAAHDDDPVSIRAIERWLGDATADLPYAAPAAETGLSMAVVGAGPCGLAAAFYLRRSGHEVTVLDRREQPGGLLRYGIPEYRLPSAIVDAEVARLEDIGIRFCGGVALGVDLTLEDLQQRHVAVFLATGAWHERSLGIPGESLLEPGLHFLEAVNRGDVTLPGRRCAVIGGGNTAMDVARVVRRLGAEVTVLYRRSQAEMPAIREEYDCAVADGVRFEWLAAPRAVAKDGGDLVVTLERMKLGDVDASGRPRPQATGVVWVDRYDAVFAATGESADMKPLPARLKDRTGWLRLGFDGCTPDPSVFAGGDLATGPATVIAAIAAGRRAARAIDASLGFESRWPAELPDDPVAVAEVNPSYVPRHARTVEPSSQPGHPFAEDTLTLERADVLAEIERCYSCGHCNACGTCFVFCPDAAITWDEGPVIDLDFCKGCGICVTECPGHAFVLINERELTHA